MQIKYNKMKQLIFWFTTIYIEVRWNFLDFITKFIGSVNQYIIEIN